MATKRLSVVSSAPVDLSHAASAEPLGDHEAADRGAGEGIRSRVGRSSRRGRLDLICH